MAGKQAGRTHAARAAPRDKAALPAWLDPELATLTSDRFSDPAWIFERKLDGERCLGVRRRLRRAADDPQPSTTSRTPSRRSPRRWPPSALGDDFVVDGEIVAFDEDQTKFGLLQHRLGVINPAARLLAEVPAYYYLFDVLYADGRDVRPLPLLERKKILRGLPSFDGPLRFTEHRDTEGEAFYRQACRDGWEGLIAKRADAPYRSRARPGLAEVQVPQRPGVRHRRLHRPAALTDRVRRAAARLLRPRTDGLVYAGKVGTGFTNQMLRSLHDRLAAIERPRPAVRRRPAAALGVGGALGRAPAGRRGRVQRVDLGRGAAPPAVPGAAGRQGSPRGGPGGPPARGPGHERPARRERDHRGNQRSSCRNTGKLLFDDPGSPRAT